VEAVDHVKTLPLINTDDTDYSEHWLSYPSATFFIFDLCYQCHQWQDFSLPWYIPMFDLA